MSTVESTVTVVAVEVAVVLLVVAAVQWFIRHRHHGRELKAMKRLVEDLKSGGEERHAELQTFLGERLKLEPEQVAEAAAALSEQEGAFYRYLMRSYLKRDHDALGRLRQNLGAVLSGYHDLLAEAVHSRESLEEAQAERERLQGENEALSRERDLLLAEKVRLEEEKAITLNTVNQMLDEYSNLFSGGDLPTKRLPSDSVLERVLTTVELEASAEGQAKGEAKGEA